MWLLLSQFRDAGLDRPRPGGQHRFLAWVTLNLPSRPLASPTAGQDRRFILRVVGDVIRSNIAVTLIILRAGSVR